MDITLIFKVAGVGILISVLNMILTKVDRSDWATLTTIAGVVIVLELVIGEISDLFNTEMCIRDRYRYESKNS